MADPSDYQAWMDLGESLLKTRRLEDAGAAFERALSLKPRHPLPLRRMAKAWMGLGQLDQAIACYDRAVEINPADASSAGLRLFSLIFHPDFDAQALLGQCKAWDDRYARALTTAAAAHENDRTAGRRLRIGYVSPNFRGQAQAFFIAPLLANHDHEKVEVFCYADSAKRDFITEAIQRTADIWRQIEGRPAAAVAELVRSDRIDILVDLSLHMGGGRPLLMARKPAPVQVAWLAYPGTTGLAAMDYRFTDGYIDPPGVSDDDYTEQCVRLPHTFACFDPTLGGEELAGPASPPALSGEPVTFGCLCHLSKINAGVLSLWSRVLLAVPRSRLLLLAPPGAGRQWVSDRLSALGVGPDRLEFADFAPHQQYMGTYLRVDIGLDTFPYNGHTTNLDSLYMGVPVVTRIGNRAAGRTGWSVLSNLNLPELAAVSDEQFISIATELAGDLARLAELRRTLRQRLADSPISDGRRFAQAVEEAYQAIWQRWISR